MASAGRRRELQALGFDPKYLQFKPQGSGVTLYFSPEFMFKKQRPSQTSDPWCIPAVPRDKSEWGDPNCPIELYATIICFFKNRPQLHKGRRRLFISLKNNNAGKELSAANILSGPATP